jgi:hypothetical protein
MWWSQTLPVRPRVLVEPVRKENTEHPAEDSDNTRPIIIITKKAG